jgi:3,2-trans-enoyl-CoA isomerase
VAAIRGYCPAGGCVLALCCDARVCTPDTRIGLNEVELGIPVPLYWARLMASLVGAGRADKLLQTAAMVPAQEAVSLGLVDAAVPTAELLAAAQAELARRLAFPDSGRVATKRALRAPMAEAWHAYTEEEAQGGWVGLSQPRVVQALAGVMARLSKAQPAPKL